MRVWVPVLAGAVVMILLFPYYGIDTDPPECYAVFDYVVPCTDWFAPVGALAAAGLVGLGIAVGARWSGRDEP